MPIERAAAMRALFDVNVMIALLDPDHIGHETATVWFAENLSQGWASCPITENGAARIMASPAYPNPLPVAEVLGRIRNAASAGHHRFWPDDVSITDTAIFNPTQLLGPRQITDRYLLALAVANDGRLVTFDRRPEKWGQTTFSSRFLPRLWASSQETVAPVVGGVFWRGGRGGRAKFGVRSQRRFRAESARRPERSRHWSPRESDAGRIRHRSGARGGASAALRKIGGSVSIANKTWSVPYFSPGLIARVEEAGPAVVAALNQMQGASGIGQARAAGHRHHSQRLMRGLA
jgi:toxin-antitoxin system PIN domain toxin